MKSVKIFICSALISIIVSGFAQADQVNTINDYNNSLIDYGVSWKAGDYTYYPSFYTGFAPRVEDANRIHFHLSRGNQIRLTATLDDLSVLSYLYGLKKRVDLYEELVSSGQIAPTQQMQIDSFKSILKSDVYKIDEIISLLESGKTNKADFYSQSLNVMKALNPGRIFTMNLDLAKSFLTWRDHELKNLALATQEKTSLDQNSLVTYWSESKDKSVTQNLIRVANNLLFARINITYLNNTQLAKLAYLLIQFQNSPMSDDAFVMQTLDLFNDLTSNRYLFNTVDNGQFRKAIICPSAKSCTLSMSEFTAVYPNGSAKSYTQDRNGYKIPVIREEGVLTFVARDYHDVDHIRKNPYYGWIPKMDYSIEGNGIHNAAVRTYLKSNSYEWLYNELGIPAEHDTLWVVSRGGVSHGCTRMSGGHAWEVRHVFPADPEKMKSLKYTGNSSGDFDLFDIDGDGKLEVMGSDYTIAYALASDSGAGYREGNGFIDEALNKDMFFPLLYGPKQYSFLDASYYIIDPYISYFSGKEGATRANPFSVKYQGSFKLYEQKYEKDKMQFYDLPKLSIGSLSSNGNNYTNKSLQVVRLFGRVSACGPFAKEFSACYEQKFNQEKDLLLASLKK